MASPIDRLRSHAHQVRSRLSASPLGARVAGQLRGSPAYALPPLPERPLLSVVVPAYQVQEYVGKCLDSLLAQTYQHLEIIVVDDGSTDLSGDIARRYAEQDPRIVLVEQENAGLGAARNAGLERATGDLVTFADSDDTVPPTAYQRMVATLQQSGSDFVVGAVVREESGVLKMRPWVKRAHARRRLAVTIEDVPDMLINVVACTKVFRRDFTERISLRFPVGTRYEDQVPITTAYLEARAFDVIPSIVYEWRTRDDRTSITQQKAEMQDLVDRLAVQREIADLLHERASEAVLRRWYVKTFRLDFMAYLRVAADANDDYWQVLQEGIFRLARRAPTDLDDDVEVRVRIAVWLARANQRRALRRLVRDEGFSGSNFPVRWYDGHLHADAAFLVDASPVPEHVLRIRAVDLRLQPLLHAVDWSEDGRLSLSCVAPLAYVDPREHEVTTSYSLVGPTPTSQLEVATRVTPDPSANLVARRPHEDHTTSMVQGGIDLRSLVAASEVRELTRWEVRVTVGALGMQASAPLVGRTGHGSAVNPRSRVVAGALVSTTWSERRGLLVEVRRRYAAVTGLSMPGDATLRLRVAVAGTSVERVLVDESWVDAQVTGHGDGDCAVSIPLSSLRATAGRVCIDTPDAGAVPLVLAVETDPVGLSDAELCVGGDAAGLLAVAPVAPTLLVDDVLPGADLLTVSGRVLGRVGADHRLALSGSRACTAAVPVRVADGRFSVQLPTHHSRWSPGESALPANSYSLVEREPDPNGADPAGHTLQVLAGRLFDEPAPRLAAEGWSVEVAADRRLSLRRTRHRPPWASSRFEQQSLRTRVYAPALAGPGRDLAVFECFGGSGTGDSPGALCERLGQRGTELDLVWSVNDLAVVPPPGTRAVLRQSAEWFEAMASARLLVNNSTFPEYVGKGRHQTYVQTWRGTPVKRIGNDIANPWVWTEHAIRLLLQEVDHWDHLVSPSPFCSQVFRKAFGYDGEILEVGRPGNDLLIGPDAARVRAEVRAALGVPEHQQVLLYAPTWRDNARRGKSWQKVLHLDHELVTAARPDVTVLLRGHPETSSRPDVRSGDRVVDVTSYPDFARLMLAADVLVTDYSSAMVDFALTDRPVVLLAPDLEIYRDRIRGFYLDLEAIAPGPVVRSTREVLDCLPDVTGSEVGDRDQWASARRRLRAEFAPLDDGHAADRVLTALGCQ